MFLRSDTHEKIYLDLYTDECLSAPGPSDKPRLNVTSSGSTAIPRQSITFCASLSAILLLSNKRKRNLMVESLIVRGRTSKRRLATW